MILTRDKGQRMWGGGGGSSYSYGGGGGGESPSFDGFVSNEYYNQNFELLYKQEVTAGGTTTTTFMTAAPNIIVPVGTVTDETTQTTTVTSLVGPVAKNAIVLGNIMMVYDQTNNAIKVVNRDGSTAANFYATGGVSALGYNPGGGGGGGADLNALLDNINSSNIGDIAPTASEVGKCLVYNGNNQWAWATPGGGGGGIDNVSVASTGLLTGGSVSGSSIILNTRTIQASDLPDLSSTYVKWTNVNRTSYSSWDKIPFVNARGSMDIGKTLEFHSSNGDSTDYNAVLMLDSSKTYNTVDLTLPNTSGTLATQSWVNSQGFVKSSGVTSVGLSMPTGFSVSNSPVTSSGTLSVGIASGYFIPTTTQRTTWNNKQDAISDLSTIRSNASHGETAYGWGNHANAGYMLRTEGMRFSIYGNSYIAARFVNADGTYDSTRAAKARGSGYIEWWSDGYFNHRMGSVSIYDGANDDTCYLQIGGGRIYWDPSSKSLYVVQSDGSTPANLYATGGVSALGISTGGSPSVSELTVNTLKGVRYLQNASGAVSITSGNSYIYIGAGSGSNVYIADSSNTYFDTNGHLHLTGKRLYLDSTRYVYVSNSHLYFYNGSSSVQIA